VGALTDRSFETDTLNPALPGHPRHTPPMARDLRSIDHELIPQPLQLARSLPARFYVDPATAMFDRHAVFDRGWHLVAHLSQLRDAGDHVVADLAGLPVIAVRGADDEIRVFHNVCRHRAGPIALCDGLAAKSLRCRYHGWTYGLDGVLASAPEMGTAQDFDVTSIRLPQLRTRVWHGLVFAAVDATPDMEFDALVEGIGVRIGMDQRLSDYGHHQRVGYEVACNWKVYVDNYLEGYHVPHIHPALNRMLDYRSYVTEIHEWHSLQWSPLDSDDALYGSGEALYYWLWPNTMLNILPGRLQTNRVIPKGVDRCRVEFDFYYAPDQEGQADSGAARARREADLGFSDEVQHEDLAICADVQRGLASGSYQPGRLNPLREQAVHHFQELLRRAWREAGTIP
jgi:choline monooxygenase